MVYGRLFIWLRAITLALFIFLCFESCLKEETPVDISPLVHGWEVISFNSPETVGEQKAINTHLIEFQDNALFGIDFDRDGCSSKYHVPNKGMITFEPFSIDFCSSTTKYAQDLQKLLLNSTSYVINGDSNLTLSGIGEIKLKRSLDCAGAACQKNVVVIYMTIRKADGSDVNLTRSKLVRLTDDKIIRLLDYPPRPPDWPANLPYPLIDDSYRKELAGKKVEVEFQGFVNETLIVKRLFTITADCCHVDLVSGDLNIVVD